MKKIYEAVDRFCARHPRFGVPNLMRYVVIGNVVVYFLMMLTRNADANALDFLAFHLDGLLHGEIWRIITFIFVPNTSGAFMLLIALYFYYWIGSTLERQWGTAKFNLYYFSGVLLTVIGTVLASLISGTNFTIVGTEYVNLSMFLAFAALYPDAQVLLFFIIPIKMKWLAILDAVLFAVDILGALLRLDFVSALIPVIALLNFLVFFWTDLSEAFGSRRRMARHQNSHQTIQFKSAVKQQQKKESQQGYRHKCCVCGRTDTDYPDLEFRYCSRCAGYHCFCQDHIFNHVHFTE